jgi:hypothetical protein
MAWVMNTKNAYRILKPESPGIKPLERRIRWLVIIINFKDADGMETTSGGI